MPKRKHVPTPTPATPWRTRVIYTRPTGDHEVVYSTTTNAFNGTDARKQAMNLLDHYRNQLTVSTEPVGQPLPVPTGSLSRAKASRRTRPSSTGTSPALVD